MAITIERAIEVIGEDGLESGEGTWQEYLAAIQLGIEALRRLQQARTGNLTPISEPLPGEAEE